MQKKILLVEDEKNIREIIAFTLRQRGLKVIEVAEGDEVIPKVETERPDLIVLDVMLPGKSGFEICSDLKGNPSYKDIPILIMTAITRGTGKDDLYWREKSRADDLISKPFRMQKLVERIHKLLDLRS